MPSTFATCRSIVVVGCFIAIFAVLSGPASSAAAEKAPEFPTSPEQWINSAPLTLESLKGKAVVLYYFEEECPRCRGMWPARLEMAKKYEGQPILFIAVNSGTPRPAIQTYVKEVGVTWPVLLDFDRSFEKSSSLPEINLNNILQVKSIDGKGRFEYTNSDKMEETVEKLLKTAHWRVDPAAVPAALKPAWQAVELANFPAAASTIKKSLTSPKADVRQGAEKLQAAVQQEIDAALAAADKLAKSDKKWEAYKAYLQVTDRFQGFTMPETVSAAKTELSADDRVKIELAGYKSLQSAKKLVATDGSPTHSRATNALKKVVQEHGSTEAGAEAKELLASFGR